ncbi:hypothetical protein K470DRAFT_282395 [Piedraia hortae CBS 480.64]|uniref:Uncharacterized protein n=1 Tax=Piedraia hortae CBS 480.64 TaxID=1314780 RepID=A0A6A7BY20_9PEZI|nr:hypothetical protein K470DRAFT_282395 [Piedraia hortae CBS 480.64]
MLPRRRSRRSSGKVRKLATCLLTLILLAYASPRTRRWMFSGCAWETLLLAYGSMRGYRILPQVPLWPVVTTLNLVYAVCSTSWLLRWILNFSCYPLIVVTCLNQFPFAAKHARRSLRKLLRGLQFTRDRIAFFNIPGLEIDTDVHGLLVIRGISISLSSLTIVAHGVNVGIKLADDLELSLMADEVTIKLFRRINCGDVYANLKGGAAEMTFAECERVPSNEESDDFFVNDTPLLRAATAGSEKYSVRPKLRKSLTGVDLVKDSLPEDAVDTVTTLSPDEAEADQKYRQYLKDIKTSSAVYQCRQQVLKRRRTDGVPIDSETDLRAAICSEMHDLPSITHAPERSVKVTTLRLLTNPRVRSFLHRMPFLLRMLLSVLSYCHIVEIASITAAGSGKWLTAMLQREVFKHYSTLDSDIRKLERRVLTWLADANFCVQLADIQGLGQVPLSTEFDITGSLQFSDIIAYRTLLESGTPTQVVRLGGADATVAIPSFLLPHHEHLLPPPPDESDEQEQQDEVDQADGLPKTVQAERKLKRVKKDETTMNVSVHAQLPIALDLSLLNFVAALVKATKIIEIEKQADEADSPTEIDLPVTPKDDDALSISSSMTNKSTKIKSFANQMRERIKEGTNPDAIKAFAKDLHQSAKDGMKKAAIGGAINDRWIAKMVGRIASKLEKAYGDVGYSRDIPISLKEFRPEGPMPGKILA